MDSATGDSVEGAELPLAEAIEKGEGCRIVGNTSLLKVPTTVFITTEDKYHKIHELSNSGQHDLVKRINMAHYFSEYNFQNLNSREDMANLKKAFKDYPSHLNFDLANQIKPEFVESDKVYDYYQFCKLVAHSFVDNFEGKSYQAWQYSLT